MIMHFMIYARGQHSVSMQEVVCPMCSHAETLQGVEFGVLDGHKSKVSLTFMQ